MSDKLPTIKVKDENPRGWKIINASDFDPDKHEIFGAVVTKQKAVDPVPVLTPSYPDAPEEKPAPKRRGRKPKAASKTV